VKRVVKIKAVGVDLTITIEGDAPCGLGRVLAREVSGVAFDFVADVTVSDEVYGETMEP
jgi:hypothetical protein